MLKTNSKKVIERIKAYIVENTESELIEAIEWENLHHKNEISEEVKNLYNNNKLCEACCLYILEDWKIRRNPNHPKNYQDNFIDWLNGLPLNIADYIVHEPSASDILAEWLEESEAEKTRHTAEQAEYLLGYLIYREALKIAQKHGFRTV